MYVIKRKSDGWYFTGVDNRYNQHLEFAKFYSKEERELCFCYGDEEWVSVPYTQIVADA